MNNKEFIAELHDIGKLVDKTKLKNYSFGGHTFENFKFDEYKIEKPCSPSWWGQYHHKIKGSKNINNWTKVDPNYRPDVFLLIIADHLASSISRAVPPIGGAGESEGVLKLWNYKFYENEKNKGKCWAAFKSDEELKEVFRIINEVSSPYEFFRKISGKSFTYS